MKLSFVTAAPNPLRMIWSGHVLIDKIVVSNWSTKISDDWRRSSNLRMILGIRAMHTTG